MKYRDFYSDDPDDYILCENCDEVTRWFTLEKRPWGAPNVMGTLSFRLPCCGSTLEVFDDVIPLRGQPA